MRKLRTILLTLAGLAVAVQDDPLLLVRKGDMGSDPTRSHPFSAWRFLKSTPSKKS